MSPGLTTGRRRAALSSAAYRSAMLSGEIKTAGTQMKGYMRVAVAGLVMGAQIAQADVTTQENIALDLAGAIKMHGTTVDRTTDDKRRSDTELHCEGFMSLLRATPRAARSFGSIAISRGNCIRTRRAIWRRRSPRPKSVRSRSKSSMRTIRRCRSARKQQPRSRPAKGDTSDCELSPPKVDMRTTDEHASIAGHDTRKSSVKMSQTCTDKKTGDICEFVYGFDVWLTPDDIGGLGDRRAFQRAYMSKMGLDENNPAFKGAMQQFMAAYAGTLKDMSAKAASLKGYPLRTTFRLIIGGDHCSKAKSSDDQDSGGRRQAACRAWRPAS